MTKKIEIGDCARYKDEIWILNERLDDYEDRESELAHMICDLEEELRDTDEENRYLVEKVGELLNKVNRYKKEIAGLEGLLEAYREHDL